MGLKKFINNIRYLARYNIKEMNSLINKKLDYTDLKEIINIISHIDNFKQLKIINIEETIQLLIKTNKSLVRYGDGEFMLMSGIDIPFQSHSQKLNDRLHEIFNDSRENIMIGITGLYYKIEFNKYFDEVYDYIFHTIIKNRKTYCDIIDTHKQYVSSEITILYQQYKEYDFETYFNKIKKIWENKEIVIVCGETVFNNIDYNIFENSKSIDYIYAPSRNAFDKYDELLAKSLEYSKDKLFIIILGPTANILAYDLANTGYRALDLGHIAKDYNAYMKKIERNGTKIGEFFLPD